MATPIKVTFATVEPTNSVWFPNASSFNNFMSNNEGTIEPLNLPAATTAAQGAVKQATITYNYDAIAINSGNIVARANALSTSYASLLSALSAAGIIKLP